MNEPKPDGSKLRFFVTGTDTGAGKTVVCAALARCLMANGKTVSLIKPFQTGCGEGDVSDADFVCRATGKPFSPKDASPYQLREPLSPMAAAEIEGVEIDTDAVIRMIAGQARRVDAVIVEGAGGLMAPVKEGYFMADFARDLGFKTVIAAKPGLGTINHTLLTVEAAAARNLDIAGVVICGYPREKKVCEETNLAFLSGLPDAKTKIAGVIPFIAGLNVEKGKTGGLADEDCRRFFTPDLHGTAGEKDAV